MHATHRAGSKESKQETQSERIEGTNYFDVFQSICLCHSDDKVAQCLGFV